MIAAVNPGKNRGLDLLARFGYLSRGAVYLVMGAVAARAAVLSRGRARGAAGALRIILGGPHGTLLVEIVAAGFLAFAVFRGAQAISSRTGGWLRRGSCAAGGLISAGLAATAWRVRARATGGSGSAALRESAARLVARPWGRDLLVLAGAAVAAAGVVEILSALSGRFPEKFVLGKMGPRTRKWALRSTRFGLAAHGAILLTIGYFVSRAALDANPREILETGGALRKLGQPPFGSLTAAAVSLGLSAYGLYMWFLARYRRKA